MVLADDVRVRRAAQQRAGHEDVACPASENDRRGAICVDGVHEPCGGLPDELLVEIRPAPRERVRAVVVAFHAQGHVEGRHVQARFDQQVPSALNPQLRGEPLLRKYGIDVSEDAM